MTRPPLVEMRAISKTFGAVRALQPRRSRPSPPGEVLGLVGDNAAGKSTLMKILAGADHAGCRRDPDRRRAGHFDGPIAAAPAGIEMVYQDFALVPQLTVTQNIFLGREMLRTGSACRFLERQRRWTSGRSELFAALGLRVPSVTAPVRALSGGQQQAVAIARATALRRRARDHGRADRESRRAGDRQGARDRSAA